MSPESDSSTLFSVRIWMTETSNNCVEHRGSVQHVLSGETRHFRDWNALVAFLIEQSDWKEDSGISDRTVL